jgi:hypothetical protein
MSEGRFLTNYKSATANNEYIKYLNGIVDNDDYRLFLQVNATKIMDSDWTYLIKNDSCWNNACVHNYPLRMNPRLFEQERKNSNLLFTQKELPANLNCELHSHYRLTETPLQNSQITSKTCTK